MSTKSLLPLMAAMIAIAGGQALAADAPDALVAKAKADGSVRVIVSFAEPSTAAALSVAAVGTADAAHVATLRRVQSAILDAALGAAAAARESGDDPHAVTLMDVSPMLAATVDAGELARLAADPRVTDIQEDTLAQPTLIQSTGLVKMTGASGAWAKGATGTNRIVAVLDTGVNKNHEFLAGKVVSEACYNTKDTTYGSTSRCPGGATSSTAAGAGLDCGPAITGCGHGTHVAGIAAGLNSSQSAGEPSKGVAYNAKVLAIDIFSRFNRNNSQLPCGAGATKDCVLSWTSDQIKGLERVYALRAGIGGRKIASINMSLGGGAYTGTCDTDTRKPIIDRLRTAGIITTIAAGNSYSTSTISAPGCISTAFTVAASSKWATGNPEKISSYSNMAPPVDVFAPGGDFSYPSALGGATTILSSHQSSYAYLAGTSMAAPHVAGAIAAMRSRAACSTKTVAQIENALRTTGQAITDTRSGGTLTRKRINVAAAIQALCP